MMEVKESKLITSEINSLTAKFKSALDGHTKAIVAYLKARRTFLESLH